MKSTEHAIQVRGIKVQVVRKAIKNLHLGVYPPNGRVRVAAPLSMPNDAVRLAVVGKLAWIGRQRTQFRKQARQPKREMVSGESHYFLGRRYRLRVVEVVGAKAQGVVLRPASIELRVHRGAGVGKRKAVLDRWYRGQLRQVAEPLLRKWQERLGVEVAFWGVKRMRTKWGACNAKARRVWLNLELVKSPRECIEYVVLHELVHFHVAHHDDRFFLLMERHMPAWRTRRGLLNAVPLSYAAWPC